MGDAMTCDAMGARRAGPRAMGGSGGAPRLIVLLLVAAGLAGAGCGRGRAPEVPRADQVLARVGPYRITPADLEFRITQMPEAAQESLKDPEKQAVLLEQMVDEKLIRIAAESQHRDRDPEYQRYVEDMKTQLLSRYYTDKVLVPMAAPDSNEVRRYYEEHPAEFRVAERVAARQIVVATAAEAEDVRRRLKAGADFKSLLPRSIDQQTKALDGALGWVSRGAPVRGLGQNDAFVEAVLALPLEEVSAPIRTDKGYHVVRVEEREPERARELAAVRPSLERRLSSQKFKDIGQQLVDSLRARYKVEVDQKALLGEEGFREHSAKQLFDKAQNTEDPRERVRLYEQVVADHQGTKYAAQAQFMIGFVYAEEIKDKERARAALEQVIAHYPESELVDSARYMLKYMDTPPPMPGAASPDPAGAASGPR
jgi:peptidyl-prolyl cis-trans isomerase C